MPLAIAEAYLNVRDKAFFQTFYFATKVPFVVAEAYLNLRDMAFFRTFYFATDDAVRCSRGLLKPAGQGLLLDILPPTMLLLLPKPI